MTTANMATDFAKGAIGLAVSGAQAISADGFGDLLGMKSPAHSAALAGFDRAFSAAPTLGR